MGGADKLTAQLASKVPVMAVAVVILLGIVYLYVTAVTGLACSDVDCGLGFCIDRSEGGYQCICLPGYEGERCDKPISTDRFVRNTEVCDNMLCQNGGTCISLIDGEAGVDMGETAIDGEAALDSDGESMIDCDMTGICFLCVCAPGFTGSLCSGKLTRMYNIIIHQYAVCFRE